MSSTLPNTPVSPMSDGSDSWMASPPVSNKGSPSSNKGSPTSSRKGSPKSSKNKVAPEPEENLSNDVTQAEAIVQGANDMLNKRGTGLIVLVQKGKHFYLDFLNIKVRNPNERVIRVYLSKKKARGVKDQNYLEKRSTALDLKLGDDGAFMGEHVVGVPFFRQHLGTALQGFGGVNPLTWTGITFAKSAQAIPRTPTADIYAFANLGPPQDFDLDEEEAKGEAAALEERRMLDLMLGQARGSLTLKDVKRKAEAAFRHLGKDNRTDELEYADFCLGMKYLGIHLTESRSRKLFMIADLSSNGEIDAGEFEMAVHINDKIPVNDSMSPMDAFAIFDEKMRGGVDAIEFHKLLVALGVSITATGSMAEFNASDGDNSGVLDYEEFRGIWLRICDVVAELNRRNKAGVSEEKVKKAKIRDKMDREHLTKLIEKEEATERKIFADAKLQIVNERRVARMAKSERTSKRRADRTREANIARREKAKLEREKKSRASVRNREVQRRQRVEAELLDELETQKVARKERELIELHVRRREKSQQEEQEREARGEHEVNLTQKDLRIVPTFLYKSRQARIRLNSLQLLDISNNKLLSLPESGCFFHCQALKKLDISNNRLQSLPDEIADCTELIIVNMQNNDITELPTKFVTQCVNIRKLNIAENEMIRLPGEFGQLVCFQL
jgi:Ca2+-binding EF-hand superfamily protein